MNQRYEKQESELQRLILNFNNFKKASSGLDQYIMRQLAQLRNKIDKQKVTPQPAKKEEIIPAEPQWRVTVNVQDELNDNYPFSDLKYSNAYKEGRVFYGRKEFTKAKYKFHELLKLNPPFWHAQLYYLWSVYYESPVKAASDMDVHRLLNQFPADYEKINEVYKLQSMLCMENGFYTQGIEYGESALDQKNPEIEFRIYLAKYAFLAEDYLHCISFLDTPEVKKQKNPVCYYQLGVSYHKTNNRTKAIENYEKAIVLNAKQIDIYKNIGYLYAENKEYKKAISAFETYLKSEKSAEVSLALGECYLKFEEIKK
ncbi:MAG: tetratricopeptide repeat protein [Spirochaetales bacterium]|nr:tetratricopeptide repeat protein [Spirochaetales bacterium]